MMYIVIGNIIVWLFAMMDTTGTLYSLMYFDPYLFCHGQVWRIITFALVPMNNGIIWLIITLYFYYFIGNTLEQAWGKGKFTIYYLCNMLLTALYSLVFFWITGKRVLVTAAYLNLSMFFAFATLWPDQRVLLFFIIPVKMKWLAWIDAAFFVIEIISYLIQGSLGLALVPVVAMLGYFIFCGGWLIDFFRPAHAKQKARTIQFKQAAKKVQKAQKSQSFTRQCAVCGRTDADHPELEFRYCSRCAGYHCFCSDHINNHVHFTE